MIFLTVTCNFWTFLLSSAVMYMLVAEIMSAKRNSELRRKRLYVLTCLFVSLIMVLSALCQFCVQAPDYVQYFDILMELYMLFSLYIYFI